MHIMTHWLRFLYRGETGFGTLAPAGIAVHRGDMFSHNGPTGQILSPADVTLLAPSTPSKVIALWNNFHALAAKLNVAEPPEPLYLMKANTSIAAPGAALPRPASYAGKVVYE